MKIRDYSRRMNCRSSLRYVGLLFAAVAFAQTDDSAFFDNSTLQEIRLSVAESDWKSLRDNYLDNTYYPSDFTWNGVAVTKIGIRSRGAGSRSPEKPNLTLNFSKYVGGQRFLGLDSVTIKANNQEPSMIRETTAMQVYRHFGIPAPREAHVKLFVNGEFFGLYTIVEAINEDFLARNFGESDGYLYEFNPVGDGYHFEYLGDNPSAYSMLEPQTHKKSPDTATLIEAIRRVNQATDSEFLSSVSPYLDLRGFVTLIALEDYLSDNDGVLSSVYGMNNFYLYRFQTGTVHTFIPWDSDLTFNWDQSPVLDRVSGNVLVRRVLAIPKFKQLYLDTLLQAAAFAGSKGGWMQQEIQRQFALIADDARNDPHKQCMKNGSGVAPCDAADFEAGVAALMQFVPSRTAFVEAEVGKLLPGGAPQVSSGGVVSAARSQPLLAPGGLATLYGHAFAKTVEQASAFPLPDTLDGVSVTVNGVPAPLLYVSPNQLTIQVPWSATEGPAVVTVSSAGLKSSPVQAMIARTAPAIFAVVPAGGSALAIYATGLGHVSPPSRDGEAAPFGPLATCLETASASIGGQDAGVTFCGLAPGMAGVFKVNVEVPNAIAAGTSTELTLSIGGQTSPGMAIVTP